MIMKETDASSPVRLVLVGESSAAPERVFEWLTRADRLTRWWAQEAEVEAAEGGSLRLSWPAMGWVLFGRWVRFEPARRLEMTWNWEHRPELPERLVTFELEPCGAGTSLTVTHGDYGEGEVESEDRQSHVDGWTHFLARLEECLAQA